MDTLTVQIEITIDELGKHLWGGARRRWNGADNDTRQKIWDLLCEYDLIDIHKINEFLWLDCNEIFYPDEAARERVILSETP